VSGPRRFPEGWDAKDEGYLGAIPMEDGRMWCLMPLTFGRVRIVIAEDQFTAGEHWCYSDYMVGLLNWNLGPDHTPEGWSRHMLPDGTFERRDEHGNLYQGVD
jgi:hypothetical protein